MGALSGLIDGVLTLLAETTGQSRASRFAWAALAALLVLTAGVVAWLVWGASS